MADRSMLTAVYGESIRPAITRETERLPKQTIQLSKRLRVPIMAPSQMEFPAPLRRP